MVTKSKTLISQGAIPPRLFGLSKVHKDGVPLRLIISTIGRLTYKLAKYLCGLLQPMIGICDHHDRNSIEFIKTLNNIKIENSDIIFHFAVMSFYSQDYLSRRPSYFFKIILIRRL